MVLKEHTGVYNAAPLKRQRQPRGRQWAQHEREAPAARLDLSKMKVTSLRKYINTFDLDVSPNSSKETMTAAVHKHWQSQVLRENDVIYNMAVALKKNSSNGQQ